MMQNELKIAICDDDRRDREVLKQALIQYFEIAGTQIELVEYEDGDQIEKDEVATFDLIFMDIFMERTNGMDMARELVGRYKGLHIVFLSTSREYAAEAYDIDALHYLTKPLDIEKLNQVLDRYLFAVKKTRTITIKQNRVDKRLFLDDIYWIEAKAHSCIIHTRLGDEETTASIGDMEEELRAFDFVRVSRYALVSLNEVQTVPGKEIVINDGTVIPVGKKLQEGVLEAFRASRWRNMFREGGIE